MIQGLFETHINVHNLDQSMQFYGETLGLKLGRFESDRKVAFYWLGKANQAMLGLWEKPADQVQRQHFAFQASLEDVLKAEHWLEARGLEARNFLNDGTTRPMVFAWMPALAIYFADPNGHSLEFISPLSGSPRADLGVVSWQDWQALEGVE